MDFPVKTAVAVAVAEGVCAQILRALSEASVELQFLAHDGTGALHAVEQMRPDLLVIDQELPGAQGATLAMRVEGACLTMQPAIILLYYPEFCLPQRAHLEESGIFTVQKPLPKDGLRETIAEIQRRRFSFSPAAEKRADLLLDRLGVPQHVGRSLMRFAALACARDERMLYQLTTRLYPLAAQAVGIAPTAVERAMRHAIEAAWSSDCVEEQYRIFAETISAGRGKPTCGEMIARLADILRLEG